MVRLDMSVWTLINVVWNKTKNGNNWSQKSSGGTACIDSICKLPSEILPKHKCSSGPIILEWL